MPDRIDRAVRSGAVTGRARSGARPAAATPRCLAVRNVRCYLIALLLTLIGGGILFGPGEAVKDGHANVFMPGGMDLRTTDAALGRNPDAVDGCLPAGVGDSTTPQRAKLSRLFEILSVSDSGRDLLRQAHLRNVHVCLDDETELLAYYFSGRRMVGVSSELSEGGRLAFLAHELAHVPQHPGYSDNRYFPPQDLILLRRVREAAAEAVATRIAWELREGGYAVAWQEKVESAYGDVAQAFAAVATAPGADRLLRATRAAFDRWFEAPWRPRVYDRMTLRHLERISKDDLGLVPPRYALRHDFLLNIGWLNGRNFLAEAGAGLLTGDRYAGGLAGGHKARLNRFVNQASAGAAAAPPWLVLGMGA